MHPFAYHRSETLKAAVAGARDANASDQPPQLAAAQFIAGGTNMADYMKLDVQRPERLLDINGLDDPALRAIDITETRIRFGALVRMSEVEDHAEIRARAPVLVDSLHLAASRQIRNMASLGGNVLQRTRCEYFRETSWPCNKRDPGSGCAAMEGVNRHHAVLGVSDACIATYHGDFAQALIALEATVEVAGPDGRRTFDFADLHTLPGATPHVETVLRPDELIVAIEVPLANFQRRSRYVKVRDRESYAFALASAAVALDLDGDTVRDARIALGGLATVPWRARAAEAALRGKALDEGAAEEAASAAFAEAVPHAHNAFKIPLGRRTLVRALMETRDMEISA